MQAHTKSPKVETNILLVMADWQEKSTLNLWSVLCLCPSKVFLLPFGLARKRIWNAKYPICIQLAAGWKHQEGERGGLTENFKVDLGAESAQTGSKQSHDPPTTLYLFGRTGREKEEWFHHLLLASMDTEVESEKDRQRHVRCVPRLGRRNITKCTPLEKQISVQIQHMWVDYRLYT